MSNYCNNNHERFVDFYNFPRLDNYCILFEYRVCHKIAI